MEFAPVFQAGPPFVIGLATVLVGLLLRGGLQKLVIAVGALTALGALAAAGVYVGLGLACQSWDKHPQATWLTLITLMLLTATTVMAKSTKHKHKHDEDEDEDDGGLGVWTPDPPPPAAPAPAPVPVPSDPSLDWGEFDDARQGWERTPVGV